MDSTAKMGFSFNLYKTVLQKANPQTPAQQEKVAKAGQGVLDRLEIGPGDIVNSSILAIVKQAAPKISAQARVGLYLTAMQTMASPTPGPVAAVLAKFAVQASGVASSKTRPADVLPITAATLQTIEKVAQDGDSFLASSALDAGGGRLRVDDQALTERLALQKIAGQGQEGMTLQEAIAAALSVHDSLAKSRPQATMALDKSILGHLKSDLDLSPAQQSMLHMVESNGVAGVVPFPSAVQEMITAKPGPFGASIAAFTRKLNAASPLPDFKVNLGQAALAEMMNGDDKVAAEQASMVSVTAQALPRKDAWNLIGTHLQSVEESAGSKSGKSLPLASKAAEMRMQTLRGLEQKTAGILDTLHKKLPADGVNKPHELASETLMHRTQQRPLDSSEFKILLDPGHFDDVQAGLKKFSVRLKEGVDASGVLLTKRGQGEVVKRTVAYLDTPDSALRTNGYVLRKRVENGQSVLMLKARDDDRATAALGDVAPAAKLTGQMKFEKDVTFQGEEKSVYSRSCKVTVEQKFDTVQGYAGLFPGLGELGLSPETPLKTVEDRVINEERYNLGELNLPSGERGPAYLTIWRQNKKPAIVEFSFALSGESSEAESKARALMQSLKTHTKLIGQGSTKTEFAYGK